MDLRRSAPWVAILFALSGCAARNEVIDTGDGPVDSRGRPVDRIDDHRPSDWEWETESRTEAMEEESIEDVIEDSER